MKAPEQMEMTLEAPVINRVKNRSLSRKVARATWWFNRMRSEVANAREWQPAPPPAPEPPCLVFQNAILTSDR